MIAKPNGCGIDEVWPFGRVVVTDGRNLLLIIENLGASPLFLSFPVIDRRQRGLVFH